MADGIRALALVILFTLCVLPVGMVPLAAQERPVSIETANGSADELAVAAAVRRLIDEYGLHDWMFTDRILVDQDTRIPHSHPVLTLTTRYLGDDTEILTNVVHEQLHWLVLENQGALRSALDEIRALYPEPPDGPPTGARNLRSTYLHLVVCSLEYQALEQKIGREAAEAALRSKPYYTWVFATVIDDREKLRPVLAKHGIVLP